jgi:hypothetical protein
VWTSSLVAANTAALVDPPAQHSTQHSTVQYKSTTELICGANLPFKLYARPFMSYSLLIKCAASLSTLLRRSRDHAGTCRHEKSTRGRRAGGHKWIGR